MIRAVARDVWGVLALVLASATLVHAQESPSASADATNGGVYVGGQLGVLVRLIVVVAL